MTSPKYRCDAPPTELWSHKLGARSICFLHISCEEWNDVKYIWNNHMWTVVVFCRGHRFESCWSPDFYRLLLSKCLNWKINCNDHLHFHLPPQFTLWIISYILHIISLLTGDMNSINWPRSQCEASELSWKSIALVFHGSHGFESHWSPDLFRLLLSNCLNWKIYCDDHLHFLLTLSMLSRDFDHPFLPSVIVLWAP